MNEIILTLILTAMLILVVAGSWSIIYHTSRNQSAGVTKPIEELTHDWTLEYRQYANPSDTSKFERYFHHHHAIDRLNHLNDSGPLVVAMIRPTSECKKTSDEIPSPPEPPLGRVIREGATHSCSNCGSTMSRQGFLGLFGKMICHNDKCPNSSKI